MIEIPGVFINLYAIFVNQIVVAKWALGYLFSLYCTELFLILSALVRLVIIRAPCSPFLEGLQGSPLSILLILPTVVVVSVSFLKLYLLLNAIGVCKIAIKVAPIYLDLLLFKDGHGRSIIILSYVVLSKRRVRLGCIGAVLVYVRWAFSGRSCGGSPLVADGFSRGVDLVPRTSWYLARVPTLNRDGILDRGVVLLARGLGVVVGFVGPLLALGVGGVNEDLLSLYIDIMRVSESQFVGLFLLEDNKAEALAPLHIAIDHHRLGNPANMLEGSGELDFGDLAVCRHAAYEDLEALVLAEILSALVRVHFSHMELLSS